MTRRDQGGHHDQPNDVMLAAIAGFGLAIFSTEARRPALWLLLTFFTYWLLFAALAAAVRRRIASPSSASAASASPPS